MTRALAAYQGMLRGKILLPQYGSLHHVQASNLSPRLWLIVVTFIIDNISKKSEF